MSGPSTGSGQGGFWAKNERISLFLGGFARKTKKVEK